MLNVITGVRKQIRWGRLRTVRARQRQMRARIADRISELDALKAELDELIKQNKSWALDKLMIGMFTSDIEAARAHFLAKRYWLAKKHRKHARATLVCIKLNIRSMQLDPGTRPVIN